VKVQSKSKKAEGLYVTTVWNFVQGIHQTTVLQYIDSLKLGLAGPKEYALSCASLANAGP
jgi:hypothetical protein